MEALVMTFLEILKYTLPSAVVFATAYYLIRAFLKQQSNLELIRTKANSRAEMLPARMQAYERLVLFLERIEPTHLVPRTYKPGMTAQLFQQALIRSIRDEYEHNLTQQVYVSEQAWNRVVESKDAVLRIIDLAGQRMGDKANGSALSAVMFEIIGSAGVSPTAEGVQLLKREAHQLL